VLRLIAEGRSNSGIASELVVTVATVERHVTSTFDKLKLPRHSPAARRRAAIARKGGLSSTIRMLFATHR
jgi:DNA-binding NarL/FixJ family response regulator